MHAQLRCHTAVYNKAACAAYAAARRLFGRITTSQKFSSELRSYVFTRDLQRYKKHSC